MNLWLTTSSHRTRKDSGPETKDQGPKRPGLASKKPQKTFFLPISSFLSLSSLAVGDLSDLFDLPVKNEWGYLPSKVQQNWVDLPVRLTIETCRSIVENTPIIIYQRTQFPCMHSFVFVISYCKQYIQPCKIYLQNMEQKIEMHQPYYKLILTEHLSKHRLTRSTIRLR